MSPGFILAFSLTSSDPSSSIRVGCCSKLRRFLVEITVISSILSNDSDSSAPDRLIIAEFINKKKEMVTIFLQIIFY